MGEAARVRARAVFHGHVQGVGFRYTARQVASGYDVTGYVENEPDGSVELVAEGTRDEVAAFVEAVGERMRSYIRRCEVAWGAARGEFDGFGVRFSW